MGFVSSRHTLFRVLYRLGFTPWDGHGLAGSLRSLVEGTSDSPALPAGAAIDLGCGTGDNSIYLAKHGWRVTGVDFIAKPLDKARAKAGAANAEVSFVQADVTRLSSEGVGSGFALIVDNGCLHGMSGDDRDSYVREVTAVAAPDARLMLVEFAPGATFGVAGISQEEIERRFTPAWTLLASGDEPDAGKGRFQPRYYVLQRAA